MASGGDKDLATGSTQASNPGGAGEPGEADSRSESLVGQTVGAYRIEAELGSGAMGHVYRAIHVDLSRPVAIKALHPEVAARESLVGRFFSEARAVNLIRHENIVECTDLVRGDRGRCYMVMELLEGRTLGSLMTELGRIPWPRAVAITAQIADAISAAHDKGIFHRDLKPENVFLIRRRESDDYVKVLDFGIAHLRREQGGLSATQTGEMIGTPAYMSPEQVRGARTTFKCDLYSLGIMLFEMLTGKLPFQGSTAVEVMMGHLETPAPDVSSVTRVPASLATLIGRLLEKDPDARPDSMREVAEILHKLSTRGGAAVAGDASESVAEEETARAPGDDGEASSAGAQGSEAREDQSTGAAEDGVRGVGSGSRASGLSPVAPAAESGRRSRLPMMLALAVVAIAGVTAAVLAFGGGSGDEASTGSAEQSAGGAAGLADDGEGDGGGDGAGAALGRTRLERALTAARLPETPAACRATTDIDELTRAAELLAGGSLAEVRAADRQAAQLLEARDPRSAEGLALLARARLLTGDREGAIDAAGESIQRCANALAHATTGTARLALGDRQAAIDALERAVKLDSRYTDARFNLALLLSESGRLQDARRQLDAVYFAEPTLPNLRLVRGRTLLQLGEHDAAIAELEAATRSADDPSLAWLSLGHALAGAGRDREASEAFCKAADLGRDEAKSRCRR